MATIALALGSIALMGSAYYYLEYFYTAHAIEHDIARLSTSTLSPDEYSITTSNIDTDIHSAFMRNEITSECRDDLKTKLYYVVYGRPKAGE